MIGLLDRLAKKVVSEVDHLLISEPDIQDSDFEGVNPLIWTKGNSEAFDRIDAKAGSLLTHISMMLAAATFMISAADTSDLERIIIGIELICYLFLALVCVRCLSFIDIPKTSNGHGGMDKIHLSLRTEVRKRSLLLNIAIRWMFLITFVFMLSIMAHIFL